MMANQDIFKAAGGYALKFVISPCDEKAKLKELIQSRGGELTSRPLPDAIRLAVPGIIVREDGVISTKFIHDCVQQNKLLDMNQYKVRSGNTSVGEQVSFDDSDMQHAKVIVRLEAKDRKGRNKYFFADDMILIRYLLDEHMYTQVRGRKLWTDIEKSEILPGRTWHSLKDRFLKQILPNIHSYKLKPHEVAKLTNTLVSPTKQSTSDNEITKPKYRGYIQPPEQNKGLFNNSAFTTNEQPGDNHKPSTSTDPNAKYQPLAFVETRSSPRKSGSVNKVNGGNSANNVHAKSDEPLDFNENDKNDSSSSFQTAKDSSVGMQQSQKDRSVESNANLNADSTIRDKSLNTDTTVRPKVPNTDTGVRHLGNSPGRTRMRQAKVVLDISDISGAANDSNIALNEQGTQLSTIKRTPTRPRGTVNSTEQGVREDSEDTFKSPPVSTGNRADMHEKVMDIQQSSTDKQQNGTDTQQRETHENQREHLNVSPFSSLSSTQNWDVLQIDEFDKYLMREAKMVLSPIDANQKQKDKSNERDTSSKDKQGKKLPSSVNGDTDDDDKASKRTTRSESRKSDSVSPKRPKRKADAQNKSNQRKETENTHGSKQAQSGSTKKRVASSDPDELSEEDIFRPTPVKRRKQSTNSETNKKEPAVTGQSSPPKRTRSVSSLDRQSEKSGRSLRSGKMTSIDEHNKSQSPSPIKKQRQKAETESVDKHSEVSYSPSKRLRNRISHVTRDKSDETSMTSGPGNKEGLQLRDRSRMNRREKPGANTESVFSDSEICRKRTRRDVVDESAKLNDSSKRRHQSESAAISNNKQADDNQIKTRGFSRETRVSPMKNANIRQDKRKERLTSSQSNSSGDENESQSLLPQTPVKEMTSQRKYATPSPRKVCGSPIKRRGRPRNQDLKDEAMPGTSGISNRDVSRSPDVSSIKSNGKKSSEGQRSLHDFLMLATQPSQSQNPQDDQDGNDSPSNEYTDDQIDEAYSTLKALCKRFNVSLKRVYALAYCTSGVIRDVDHYLNHGRTTTGIPLWTEKDDDALQHGNVEQYLQLEQKYGEDSVLRRQQFLASYLRSREGS